MTITEKQAAPARAGVRAAVEQGLAALRDLQSRGSARVLAPAALAELGRHDVERVLDAVDDLSREARLVGDVLQRVLAEGLAAERDEAGAEPFGPAWTNQVRRRLRQESLHKQPTAWRHAWTDAWVEALAESRWDRCDEIAEMGRERAEFALMTQMLSVTGNLAAGEPLAALPAARVLAESDQVSTRARVVLLALASRALRRLALRADQATQVAERAVALGEGSPPATRALAHAVLAEAHLSAGRLDRARQLLREALHGEVASVDLLVAAGWLSAAEGRYPQANDYFDAAAQRFGRAAVQENLLREVSGNLLWRTARRARLVEPEFALTLYDRALDRGVQGSSVHPERRVLLERAELLEQQGQNAEAARDYRRAGDMYAWVESRKAVRLYERASVLDPDVAEHHWLYGEALRTAVDAHRPELMEQQLRAAEQALSEGFRRGSPGPATAWALTSAALVSAQLHETGDPFLLVERALLLDPGYVRGLGFLVSLLRDAGLPAEAVEAVPLSAAVDSGDQVLLVQQVAALLETRRDEEVGDLLGRYLAEWSDSDDLRLLRAHVQLRRGELERALETLGGDPEDPADAAVWRYFRATCRALLGDADGERQWLSTILADATTPPGYTAWARFRLGQFARALELYRALVDDLPPTSRDPVHELDLGLVHIRRGDEAHDDLAVGERCLVQALDRLNRVDDIVHFVTCDLPLVARDLAGLEGRAAALELLRNVERRAHARCEELRSRTRSDDDVAVRLGRARRALAGHRSREALEVYSDVLPLGPPETARGLARAALARLEDGDRLHRDGRAESARQAWQEVLAAVDVHRDLTAVHEVVAAAHARMAVSGLAVASEDDVVEHLRAADRSSVGEALALVADTLPGAWDTFDALRHAWPALAGDAGAAGPPELPLDDLYGTRGADVPDRELQPLAAAVAALLPAGSPAAEHETLRRHVHDLRERLATDVGVRIPGVRVGADESLPPDTVRFLVYGDTVGQIALPPGQGLGTVLDDLETVLRENMFRWISVDDVELWAEGWDLGEAQVSEEHALPSDPRLRYRLARLLRRLLREGVPVRDRSTILSAFREAEGRGADPLPVVRAALYPATLGPDRDVPVVEVPPALQRRLRVALPDSEGTCEPGSDQLQAVLEEVRRWRASAPPPIPSVLQVHDGRLRLALWRILAAERPRVYVVADEELP